MSQAFTRTGKWLCSSSRISLKGVYICSNGRIYFIGQTGLFDVDLLKMPFLWGSLSYLCILILGHLFARWVGVAASFRSSWILSNRVWLFIFKGLQAGSLPFRKSAEFFFVPCCHALFKPPLVWYIRLVIYIFPSPAMREKQIIPATYTSTEWSYFAAMSLLWLPIFSTWSWPRVISEPVRENYYRCCPLG